MKTEEQGYDEQGTGMNVAEISSETIETEEAENRLLFANDCRSYFMFRLTDDPV